MASYATYDELATATGERRLLDMAPSNSQESPEDFFIGQLAAASGFMDSYLGSRYTVPVDSTGNENLAAMLAHCCIVHTLFSLAPGLTDIPDGVQKAHSQCMTWLKDVSSGKAELPGITSEEAIFAIVGDSAPLLPESTFRFSRDLETIFSRARR